MTTMLIVRHGQTAWNKDVRYRGIVDLPLNELGHRQAEAVGQLIARAARREMTVGEQKSWEEDDDERRGG